MNPLTVVSPPPSVGVAQLPTSEVFGPTFQGEGPHTGRPCSFVRLGLCNLACEWCDTPYTWDRSRFDVDAECPDTPIATIHTQLRTHGTSLVVLSGGEPLIHAHHLQPLLTPEWEWHVETNGTIPPPSWWADRVTHTTVSPKVATSDPAKRRLKQAALTGWAAEARAGRAVFKFVAQHSGHIETIAALAEGYTIPRTQVWVMPEGTTPEQVIRTHRLIAPTVLRYGFNTTTRLHTLLWGDERGH